MSNSIQRDVVIIGAGLAGLTLARQLLMNTDKTILLLEKRSELPSRRQKVGESLVQLGGYYFSRVLDLEEHLLRNHYMKYNLRFCWKSQGRENRNFEDYGQSFIRTFSNIASYQLDRNEIEKELIRLNQQSDRFELCAPARVGEISFAEDDKPHIVNYRAHGKEHRVETDWVVDTSGRAQVLARREGLTRSNEIHHSSSFCWVDGLVDIEKLTDLSWKETRLKRVRTTTGHLPVWLSTNQFMGEGFWFWVIPLQGKTSLGVVYDNSIISSDEVSSAEKLIEWVCREFPLFERDLAERQVLDFGRYTDYSYDCARTISDRRWAMSGESGRFSDPLYSPGSDFIALHNSMIIDAIQTTDPSKLGVKCHLYELLMRALYESLIPTFSVSYDVLGDQEAFSLKYTWELSIYFSFFVFPFINDLFVDERFALPFLQRFSRLGQLNADLQAFLSGFYQWKKVKKLTSESPLFHDFTSLQGLRAAESTFYEVGISREEAVEVLEQQLDNLQKLAQFIVAYVRSAVTGNDDFLRRTDLIDEIDLQMIRFEPDSWHSAQSNSDGPDYEWGFDWKVLEKFRSDSRLVRSGS